MSIFFHEEDLPEGLNFEGPVAVDTEAMGLHPHRDRLCLVQLSDGRGDEHLIRFGKGSAYSAPNLEALLGDPERLKLYHFARFDVAMIQAYLGFMVGVGEAVDCDVGALLAKCRQPFERKFRRRFAVLFSDYPQQRCPELS